MRRDILEDNDNKSEMEDCKSYKSFNDELYSYDCRVDCIQKIYEFNSAERDVDSMNEPVPENTIIISVVHKTTPQLMITHLPELTFETLFANIRGLAGLWLGIGICDLYLLLSIIIQKLKIFTFQLLK